MTTFSCPEIESLIKFAARGAGYDWGRAQDIAYWAGQCADENTLEMMITDLEHALDGHSTEHALLSALFIARTHERVPLESIDDAISLSYSPHHAQTLINHALAGASNTWRINGATLQRTSDTPPPPSAPPLRFTLNSELRARANTLAMRAFVPNSEESRARGAGGADD